MEQATVRRAPWHLWVVGIVSLLWYLSGMVTIVMAQHATLPGMAPDEVAYYAAKPLWQELATDLTLITTVLGSLALLLRKGMAVPAFALSIVVIGLLHIYELGTGTSRIYANNTAAVVSAFIFLGVVLNWLYARAMQRRGVLR